VNRLVGLILAVVLRSEKDGVKVGDHMYGMSTWEAYTVQPYVDGTPNHVNNSIYSTQTIGYRACPVQARGLAIVHV
jgi:NADPH-dependent curcumin reductase CurA